MTFTPTVLGSGIGAYAFLQRTRETQEAAMRENTQVKLDTEAVRERLPNISSTDELLADRQVLGVVLTAFGLEGEIDNTGFLRNVLNSDPNAPGSFANRLTDERYATLARSFNFGGIGGPTFPGASAKDTLTEQLQSLTSVDDLFTEQNTGLFLRTLEVFGLEAEVRNVPFLQSVANSDLSDPNSVANRLNDQRFVDFASAFNGGVDELPQVLRGRVSDAVADELSKIESAEELVSNARLLKSVLSQFGLEASAGNTFFLQAVLESDINDPQSMANRLTDSRYAELAAAFDFAGRAAEKNSVYEFAKTAKDNELSLISVDALLANRELLAAGMALYGLPTDTIDTNFMRQILESNLNDPDSFANRSDNEEYVAFSKAFGFGAKIADPTSTAVTRVERLIEAVDNRVGVPETVNAFFSDPALTFASLNMFDLPLTTTALDFTQRVLESDPSDPLSALNLTSNENYALFRNAVNVQAGSNFTYPAGFADAVINDYISKQFEISVGEIDNDMRLMLSLEGDLNSLIGSVTSNDGRWFQIMGTPSLRTVFEGAFNLPSAFGQLDVQQQLGVFKDRARSVFGTENVGDLLLAENLQELQRRYLATATINAQGTTSLTPASAALSILA